MADLSRWGDALAKIPSHLHGHAIEAASWAIYDLEAQVSLMEDIADIVEMAMAHARAAEATTEEKQ